MFAADGQLIDAVVFGPQVTDVSQGRFPDGAANLVTFTNATGSKRMVDAMAGKGFATRLPRGTLRCPRPTGWSFASGSMSAM